MSILKIARLGHPILRRPAEPVPVKAIRKLDFQRLIDDMIETMRENSGVGLAAPQVHEPVQIFVVEAQKGSRETGEPDTPLTVLINPRVTPATDEVVEDWEGCLSIPDIRGRVTRSVEIKVKALDRTGKEVSFAAKDFFARVIQHEVDHLEGVLFLDRMDGFESLTFLEEHARYWAKRE